MVALEPKAQPKSPTRTSRRRKGHRALALRVERENLHVICQCTACFIAISLRIARPFAVVGRTRGAGTAAMRVTYYGSQAEMPCIPRDSGRHDISAID